MLQCDEARPKCSKCVKNSRECTYTSLDPSKEWRKNIVTFSASAPTTKAPGSSSRIDDDHPTASRGSIVVTTVRQDAFDIPRPIPTLTGGGYNTQDVQILSHFAGVTSNDLIGSQLIGHIWTRDGVQLAFNV